MIYWPKGYRFFGPFGSESLPALKVGFSALIAQVANIVPSGLIQKYLSMSSTSAGVRTEIMGVWHVSSRVYNIICALTTAVVAAFLPASAFAYGQQNGPRIRRLVFHVWWVSTIWSGLAGLLFSVIPAEMTGLWSDDPTLTDWIIKMIPRSTYTGFITPVRAICSALLQSMKRGYHASALNFVGQLVALPLFSSILYFTDRNDPARIFWTYVGSDSTAAIMGLAFGAWAFWKIKDMTPEDGMREGKKETTDSVEEAIEAGENTITVFSQ
jgi:Na+-driven multidrug efflux pump